MIPNAICFFDLDGTLLDSNAQIEESTVKAIHQLKKNNILPVIASGRSPFEVREIMIKSDINSMIGMNGQLIEINRKVIYNNKIEIELLKKFCQFSTQNHHPLVYYNYSEYWANGFNETMVDAYKAISQEIPTINNSSAKLKDVNLFLMIIKTEETFEAYQEAFPNLSYFRNSPNIIDIVPKGVNKGSGVRQTLKHLGTKVPTFAFGDGPNDFDLFDACDTKIAMANGITELKERADFITKSNTNGGIIHALKHFNLL